jgi:hypothetical protein
MGKVEAKLRAAAAQDHQMADWYSTSADYADARAAAATSFSEYASATAEAAADRAASAYYEGLADSEDAAAAAAHAAGI